MKPKEYKVQLHNEIATALIGTTKSYNLLAFEFGVSNATIWQIAKARGIKRKIGRPKKVV